MSRVIVLSPQKTIYVSEQDFQFKGVFNKVVGFVLQSEFKKQTLQPMENFKRFVEKKLVHRCGALRLTLIL